MSEATKYRPSQRIVLLDLDGTLTRSDPGIIASVTKAFEGIGMPVPDREELQRFIGPAIIESMRRNHVPDDKLDQAVAIYRDYYSKRAVFDDPNNPGQKVPGRLYNSLYNGIAQQLTQLRDDGYYLALATCKPEYQAMLICRHFHVASMVDGIFGASADTSRIDKDQVIRYAFESIGITDAGKQDALMVGDRWTDVDGAKDCGLDCLGCGWGYAEPGELSSHGAYRIIDTVAELTAAINEYFAS